LYHVVDAKQRKLSLRQQGERIRVFLTAVAATSFHWRTQRNTWARDAKTEIYYGIFKVEKSKQNKGGCSPPIGSSCAFSIPLQWRERRSWQRSQIGTGGFSRRRSWLTASFTSAARTDFSTR